MRGGKGHRRTKLIDRQVEICGFRPAPLLYLIHSPHRAKSRPSVCMTHFNSFDRPPQYHRSNTTNRKEPTRAFRSDHHAVTIIIDRAFHEFIYRLWSRLSPFERI
mmetsp:Transcript_45558/g.89734  ORF Transcript_45558/g.89734 Transcript_45558/m.89734 type:complete len:105 (-) Transcript_45558:155-469(-)